MLCHILLLQCTSAGCAVCVQVQRAFSGEALFSQEAEQFHRGSPQQEAESVGISQAHKQQCIDAGIDKSTHFRQGRAVLQRDHIHQQVHGSVSHTSNGSCNLVIKF